MPRILIGGIVLLVAITLFGVFDCLTRDRTYIKVMPKPAWVLVILFVPVIGLVLWYLFGRSSFPGGGTRRSGPTAPDDDPEFLARLAEQREAEERRRRREEFERRNREDG
ncbi:PLD nuclease N-terminal domain-containing protein [Brevibacterium litoralis]|uniref:PLD nuclease N-terminal domain-containing protein n=1 Tax=Brevibacterium litoralis TaxID=3138935 RepID=UPI0032EF4A79